MSNKAARGQRMWLVGPSDELTDAILAINYAHHEVHEGKMFETGHMYTEGSPLADDGIFDIVLTTTNKNPHIVFAGSVGGDFEAYLYEGADVDADGTSLNIVCMNRKENKNSTVSAVLNPTVNSVGTRLLASFNPGGQRNQASGGVARTDTEWILRKDTVYIARLINRAGSAKQASMLAQWYEES